MNLVCWRHRSSIGESGLQGQTQGCLSGHCVASGWECQESFSGLLRYHTNVWAQPRCSLCEVLLEVLSEAQSPARGDCTHPGLLGLPVLERASLQTCWVVHWDARRHSPTRNQAIEASGTCLARCWCLHQVYSKIIRASWRKLTGKRPFAIEDMWRAGLTSCFLCMLTHH